MRRLFNPLITQSKEYAEPEWYADLWLTVVWVVYLLVYLGTLMRRTEPYTSQRDRGDTICNSFPHPIAGPPNLPTRIARRRIATT